MKALIASLTVSILILAGAVSAQTSVSIQSITNLVDDSLLAGGVSHTITLRYNLAGAPTGRQYLASNGFRIYSPDGANWGTVQGAAAQAFANLPWDYLYVNHFHKTGGSGSFGMPLSQAGGNVSGHDTVVVLLAGVNAEVGDALPAGFNDLALNITFTSNRADAGKHICFDTCQQAPGGAWEWANPDGLIEPTWSGVRCFVINCCAGKVGDVNGNGGDEPTVGDIAALIGYLFLDDARPDCLAESDVNQSGIFMNPPQDWDDVTIGDIAYLIDYLFVSHPALPDCP